MFFNVYNILDVIVFLGAGLWFGRKTSGNSWTLAIGLALPSMMMDLIFISKNGYSSILAGIGTSYLISFFLAPVAARMGMLIGKTRFKIVNSNSIKS